MTPSTTSLLIHLQPTTNQIHWSPSLYCHGNESGPSFGIMKLLHDLEAGEMIHIYVRVEYGNCSVNWEPLTPHKRLSWLGPIVTGPIKPFFTKGPSFLLFSSQMDWLGWPLFSTLAVLPFNQCGQLLHVISTISFHIHMYPSRQECRIELPLLVTVWSWLGGRNL